MNKIPDLSFADRNQEMFVLCDGEPPLWQCEWEFRELLRIWESYQHDAFPTRLLEVGTFYGGTLYQFAKIAKLGSTLVSVDLPSCPMMQVPMDAGAGRPCDSREHVADNIEAVFGHDVFLVDGDCHDAHTIERVRELGPYDFLFIDACHAYTDVRQDWENYGPMVVSGGIIAFHDIRLKTEKAGYNNNINTDQPGVSYLWDEIQKAGYKTIELHAPLDVSDEYGGNGIGVVYVD